MFRAIKAPSHRSLCREPCQEDQTYRASFAR
jgi:hypothetical protein